MDIEIPSSQATGGDASIERLVWVRAHLPSTHNTHIDAERSDWSEQQVANKKEGESSSNGTSARDRRCVCRIFSVSCRLSRVLDSAATQKKEVHYTKLPIQYN